ncbi:MAG: acyl-CoA thioesterase [Elusimicrobiota bacterium]
MHSLKQQVYYYDTDAEGVVYYGNYMRFLEVARTKFIEDLGFNLKELSSKGYLFAIKKQEIEYKFPIYYGEMIEIKTKVEEITQYRIRFFYEIYNSNNQKTTIARTDMVCINKKFHLTEMPQDLINSIKKTMVD